MAKTVKIKLSSATSSSTGPTFDLYSDANGYSSAFETGVSKTTLMSSNGYTSTVVPDSATIIRVKSVGVCTSYDDYALATPTITPTPTATPTPTPTVIGPTATPTPTPTPTMQMARIDWMLMRYARAVLTITNALGSQVLNETGTNAATRTGTIYVPENELPYTINVAYIQGLDIHYSICDLGNYTTYLESSGSINALNTEEETVISPTPMYISVNVVGQGQPAPICLQ